MSSTVTTRGGEPEGWKITRDRARCERPGCPLATADEWYAVLELPECVRRDLCDACFQDRSQEDRGEGRREAIYWRAQRKESGKRGPVLDLESLRRLFDRLGEQPEAPADGDDGEEVVDPGANARALRYFVALLLIRKKLLKLVDAQTPEQEKADLVVIDPKVEGMQPVALFAPELDTDRLAGLKDELLAAIGESGDEDDGD